MKRIILGATIVMFMLGGLVSVIFVLSPWNEEVDGDFMGEISASRLSNPVGQNAMLVSYMDDNLRTTLTNIAHTGKMHENWASGSGMEQDPYGGFSSIAGMTGTFNISLITNTGIVADQQSFGGRSNFFFIEYTNPRTSQTEFVWPDIYPPGDLAADFDVHFDRMGTYVLSIYTKIGSTPYVNQYTITVRNGIINEDFNIATFFVHHGSSESIDFYNNNQPSTINIGIRIFGFRCQSINPTIEFNTQTDIRLLNKDNANVIDDYFEHEFVLDEGLYTGLRLRRKEGILLPNGSYKIAVTIKYQSFNIYQDGSINDSNTEHTVQVSHSTFVIKEPPHPWKFPWWAILIGFTILGALGGGYIGTKRLIERTQQTHTARLTRAQRTRAEADDRNIQKLRNEIGHETEKNKDDEAMLELYDQVYDGLRRESK